MKYNYRNKKKQIVKLKFIRTNCLLNYANRIELLFFNEYSFLTIKNEYEKSWKIIVFG